MDRKLIDYLPPVLQEVADFRAINEANEPEISAAWDGLDRVMANQFLDTADEAGVVKWERELQLYPKDTDTLDERKARIKARWNAELPYTYRWLVNWLQSLCGPDNPAPAVDGYTLHVSLPSRVDYAGILDELRRRIPVNLVMVPKILLSEAKSDIFAGTAVRCVIKQQVTVMAEDDDNIMMLTDEGGKVLLSSENKILYREATT